MTGLDRRTFLGATLLGGTAALTGCARQTGELVRSGLELPQPYQVPLPIPQALPITLDAGSALSTIVQREVDLEILPGTRTRALTYNGSFPGPLVVSRSGTPLVVEHRNRTGVPTSTHLHGGHTPPASDGWPMDLVRPGQAKKYTYPMGQRAATLWYHDHAMDRTGEHVYRGLAGMHLIRDDEEEALELPHGDRELPLMIVDRSFDADGQFAYPAHPADPDALGHAAHHQPPPAGPDLPPHKVIDRDFVEGVLGDVMLVNGAPWPVHEVDAARYRLRVLNACNARRLELACDPAPPGGAPFTQVGSDGGLLTRAQNVESLPLAGAERADVIIDFSRWPVGTHVDLINHLGQGRQRQVMRFVITRSAADDSTPLDRLPAQLSEIEPLTAPDQPDRTWRFTRGTFQGRPGWVINGRTFDPNHMHASVPLDRVERWRLQSDSYHPVHIHLDPFQVLGRANRRQPLVADAGWKDTVSLAPGEIVDIAVRFTHYTGKYLLHCHNLEHEDFMMMAAFKTV